MATTLSEARASGSASVCVNIAVAASAPLKDPRGRQHPESVGARRIKCQLELRSSRQQYHTVPFQAEADTCESMMAANSDTRGFTLWFTGLSGAGKSTLAEAVDHELRLRGHQVKVLDGDHMRQELGGRLGFSKQDRDTNVRRIGGMAQQLSREGVVAIVAAISPYREVRNEVRRDHERTFVEIFVDCPLADLIKRDPKGLYAKALKGDIQAFTGVSDPYEPPSRRRSSSTPIARASKNRWRPFWTGSVARVIEP